MRALELRKDAGPEVLNFELQGFSRIHEALNPKPLNRKNPKEPYEP